MKRNEQFLRIFKVIGLLETNPSGLTVREIHSRLVHDSFDCAPRTVYRDLEAISGAYLPLVKVGEGDDSRWKLGGLATVSKSIQFSFSELMALFVARHTLETMRGSPVYDAILNVFLKIEKMLGAPGQEGLQEFNDYLGFKSRPTWQAGVSQEVLDTVHSACAEGHLLDIEYRSVTGDNKGVIKTRRVGPEKLYFADSAVYLIARDMKVDQVKMYALSRIQTATMLDEHYTSDEASSASLVRDGIGVLSMGDMEQVEIEVLEPIASYVSERRWHDSQTLLRNSNGITLRMDVRVNDELARWVLGLGPAATVKRPVGLQKRVLEMALEISAKGKTKAA